MPITLEALSASLTHIGGNRCLAAQRAPYLTDTTFGFDHSIRNSGSALLAAMVVYHEGNELTLIEITDNEIAQSKDALEKAREALEQTNKNDAQSAQLPTLRDRVAETRKKHQENQYRKMIKDNIASHTAAAAYIDIVGCQQVRALSDANIANYFTMCDIPETDIPDDLASYAAYWARSNTGIADLTLFKERITKIEWVYYHTNASQNGQLVIQASMSLPKSTDGSKYFTDAELQAAQEHMHDSKSMAKARAIPKTALIKTYAILDACGSLPEKQWYMGVKAKETYPALQYNLIVQALKQYNNAVKEKLLPAEERDPATIANSINSLVANMERATFEPSEAVVPSENDGADGDDEQAELPENDGDDDGDGNGGVDHQGWPDDGEGNGGNSDEEDDDDEDGEDDDDDDDDDDDGMDDDNNNDNRENKFSRPANLLPKNTGKNDEDVGKSIRDIFREEVEDSETELGEVKEDPEETVIQNTQTAQMIGPENKSSRTSRPKRKQVQVLPARTSSRKKR